MNNTLYNFEEIVMGLIAEQEVQKSDKSDLVGMYAFILKDKIIQNQIFIKGYVNKNHYVCQMISSIDGTCNVAKIVSIEDMKDWVIIPTRELANEIWELTEEKGWKYGIPF